VTSKEELLNVMRADINNLKAKDMQKEDEIENLKTQIEIYRRDFEMERADREKNAGEKEQYLVDLRALQRRNQELIEALAEAHKSKKSSVSPSTSTSTSASISSKSSLRDEQRPVRVCNNLCSMHEHYQHILFHLLFCQVLYPTGAAAKTADANLRCPICSKTFYALTVLQSHVNDCLDKN